MASAATTNALIKALLAQLQGGPGANEGPQNSESQPYIIAAGAEIPILSPGTAFYLTACPATLNIRTANGTYSAYTVGKGQFLRPQDEFTGLFVQNPNSQAIAFSLFVGYGSYIDNTLVLAGTAVPVVDRLSDVISSAGMAGPVTLGASAVVDFSGVPPSAQYVSRKSFQVTNLDSAETLYMLDKNGNLFSVVLPLTEKIYFTSSALGLENPNGSGVQCTYGETWNYA